MILFCLAGKAHAASVFIDTPNKSNTGEYFEVLVYADLDKESINSVDMSISYNSDLLLFSGYKNKDTFLKMWIDPPRAERDKVIFSGIIPGGVSGLFDANKKELAPLPLVKLIFKAKKTGKAEFVFQKSSLLKNDGLGTPLVHTEKGGVILITEKVGNTKVEEVTDGAEIFYTDKTPPLPFEIILIDSSLFSRTPPMIVFDTEDLDSGIKEYKMKVNDRDWSIVNSPLPIKLNFYPNTITIRAVDYYDNYKDQTIIIPGFTSKYFRFSIAELIIMVILGGSLIAYILHKNKE